MRKYQYRCIPRFQFLYPGFRQPRMSFIRLKTKETSIAEYTPLLRAGNLPSLQRMEVYLTVGDRWDNPFRQRKSGTIS